MDENNLHNELITKCLNKTASETEKQELLNWVNQSKENEQYYFTLKDLYDSAAWEKLQVEAKTSQGWELLSSQVGNDTIPSRTRLVLLGLMKYAAVLIAGILIAAFFLFPGKSKSINSEFKNQIVTGIGERTQLVLPDGTKVWVNSCSSVAYFHDYGTNSRSVYLKGEAYFQVAKNEKLPFKVITHHTEIQALGTAFNVTAYDNDNDVSAVLLEGSISFKQLKSGVSEIIQPGQKISFSKNSGQTGIESVNTESYVAWSNGETTFEHLKMEEITKRLQRIYHVTFVLQNEKIKNMRFTGTFRNYESLDQILKVINTNTNLNINLVKDTVYIK